MRDPTIFDKIDLHLIRVLHTVLTERSVSRAAIRLGRHQPVVSASLRRLRDFAGDPLLLRSGSGMVPTEVGLHMVEPSVGILRGARIKERAHAWASARWLRERVKAVASKLPDDPASVAAENR